MSRTKPFPGPHGGGWGTAGVLVVSGILGFVPLNGAPALAATTPSASAGGTPTPGGALVAAASTLSPSPTDSPSGTPSATLSPGPGGAITAVSATSTPTDTPAPSGSGAASSPAPSDPAAPSTSTAASASPTGSPSPGAGSSGTASPDPSATGTPSPSPGSAVTPSPSPSPSASTPPPTSAAGPIVVQHVAIGVIGSPGAAPVYRPVDAELDAVQQLATLRLTFQLRNTGTAPITLTPRLEYRSIPSTSFAVVPVDPTPAVPFHLEHEWTALAGGLTEAEATDEAVPAGQLRIADRDPADTPVAGRHVMTQNPDVVRTLAAGTVTEEEFTIRVSLDADPLARYEFRLTDAGTTLNPIPPTGAATSASPAAAPAAAAAPSLTAIETGNAALQLAAAAPEQLSPGQLSGVPVDQPATLSAALPAARAQAKAAASGGPAAVAVAVVSQLSGAVSGALSAGATTGTTSGTATSAATSAGDSIHGPYLLVSDQCATCHSAHSAQGQNLLRKPGPQNTLCFTCHDGTGAPQNVSSQYSNPAVPANNPATGSYYSHDVQSTAAHTLGSENEFGGVSNRHSECSDCHNSHQAKGQLSQQTATGWTASGRLSGVSGVSVLNGAAGSAPTYTFLDGETAPVTLEYQLCLKCHSGFTTLPSTAGLSPSRYPLDKGIEFNPNNPSFHPVEAAGTNQTTAMANSLSGTSPYKQWTFTPTSTIRCVNCHAGGSANTATTVAVDGDLSPHAATNQGILIRPYRDQLLKPHGQAYAAADFALCYVCHAEAPFSSERSSTASNFRYHGLHSSGISGEGSGGTGIDTAGGGQGNAVCAECHFRLHGSSQPYGTQTVSGSRLVNFAPDVTANNGVLSWTKTATGGTCTLVCHGERHTNFRY